MTFKKVFLIWLVITAVAGAKFYILRTMFKTHPLWPWAVPVLYIGILILFILYLLSVKGEKKAE